MGYEKKSIQYQNLETVPSDNLESSNFSSNTSIVTNKHDDYIDFDSFFTTPSDPKTFSSDDDVSYMIEVPGFHGLNVKVKEIYQFDDTVLDFEGAGNRYYLEKVNGEWNLMTITNSYGEVFNVNNDKFQSFLNSLGDITITHIVFGDAADTMMIFTNVGTFHLNYACDTLKHVINGDIDYLAQQNIYSDLNNLADQYGGDQNYLFSNVSDFITDDRIKAIIASNFPNEELDFADLPVLFYRMNSIGCSYIASINTIFNHFSDLSNDDWERVFGFPKVEKGDVSYHYNYPYLYLDFFLYFQKEFNGFTSLKEVIGNTLDQMSASSVASDLALSKDSIELVGARGAYQKDATKIMEQYLDRFGLKLKTAVVADDAVSAFNSVVVKSLLDADHELVITAKDFNLYSLVDENGDGLLNDVVMADVGPHAMAITGVSDDGKLIVSSWSGKYLFDPNEKVIIQPDGTAQTVAERCAYEFAIYSY